MAPGSNGWHRHIPKKKRKKIKLVMMTAEPQKEKERKNRSTLRLNIKFGAGWASDEMVVTTVDHRYRAPCITSFHVI